MAINPATARQQATEVISTALSENDASWHTTCCPPDNCIYDACAVIHALIASRLLLPDIDDFP